MPHTEIQTDPDSGRNTYSLQVFSLYRILVPAILLASMALEIAPRTLGRLYPAMAIATAAVWLLVALAQSVAVHYGRRPLKYRVAMLAAADIVAITLIVYAGGGGASGLGMLLIPVIAGIGLLVPGRSAAFFAAIGTLSLLGAETHGLLSRNFQETGFTQAGLIGASLFATAALSWILARRMQETEVIAQQRGADLADMEQLNAHIIERMGSGMLVVGEDGRIRLINNAAWRMLNHAGLVDPSTLSGLYPALDHVYRAWLAGGPGRTTIPSDGRFPEIDVRFTRLGIERPAGTLVFVEDTAEFHRQMQELKLASLGRLTASIAHEIRNPLGAISHAAQLMGESESLDTQDRRLVGIIHDQSQRMNTLIQSILGLSRRQTPRREPITLGAWLEGFAEEFRRQNGLTGGELTLHATSQGTVIEFDPDHLHQILWNLCSNALHHGRDREDRTRIEIVADAGPLGRTATIDVIDHGRGIEPKLAEEIFEPFVTGSRTGTGLGLYISRELCENNGGRLTYLPIPSGGSCFRIHFQPAGKPEAA